jgi:hypothetical protein
MKWKPTPTFDETVKWTADGYSGTSLNEHMLSSISVFQARAEKAGWEKWQALQKRLSF